MTCRSNHIFIIFLLILAFCAIESGGQKSIVKVDSFYSDSVELQLKYTVILPGNYYVDSLKQLPVVYLLHGHTGNYTSWITFANLPIELATKHRCIIILPDAGNSWYVNWTGQTDNKPHRWEDMIIKDLIPDVDLKYNTLEARKGRAIGGLSMGGYGALAIGLKNAHMFSISFSIAGAINFCKNIKSEMSRDTIDWNSPQLWSDGNKTINVNNFSTQLQRTPRGLVFKTASDADAYDPYTLLSKMENGKLPFILISCGNEDQFLNESFDFIQKVREKTNNYCFTVLPGEHENPYWQQSIKNTFLVLAETKFFLNKIN